MWRRIKRFFNWDSRRVDPVFEPTTVLDPTPSLSYGHAAQSRKMITQGIYPSGMPEGVVIHYTAGRFNPTDFLAYMREQKYVAFLIDRQAHVWQDFSLNEWGYHAGKSEWAGYKGTLNNRFVGIEIMSAGELTFKKGKYYSWFGTTVPVEEVRTGGKKHFHKFTEKQEQELISLVLWLMKTCKFGVENVVGHEEVSPGRKVDPGGALSMTMPMLREMLKAN